MADKSIVVTFKPLRHFYRLLLALPVVGLSACSTPAPYPLEYYTEIGVAPGVSYTDAKAALMKNGFSCDGTLLSKDGEASPESVSAVRCSKRYTIRPCVQRVDIEANKNNRVTAVHSLEPACAWF